MDAQCKAFIRNWWNAAHDKNAPICEQVNNIAARAGVHPNTLRRVIKTGESSISTLIKLTAATGFELSMTWGRTGDDAEIVAAARELQRL